MARESTPNVPDNVEDDSIVFGLDRNDIGALVVKTIITGILMTGIKVVQRKVDNHFDAQEAEDNVIPIVKEETPE